MLESIVSGIRDITGGDFLRLLWFWLTKNAEEDKKWDEDDEAKDTYDRTDNYNVFGLAAYLFLSFKNTIGVVTQMDNMLA